VCNYYFCFFRQDKTEGSLNYCSDNVVACFECNYYFCSSGRTKLKGSLNYCSDNVVESFECYVSSAEVGDSMIRLLGIGLLLLFVCLLLKACENASGCTTLIVHLCKGI
jgi:hypothetical protein